MGVMCSLIIGYCPKCSGFRRMKRCRHMNNQQAIDRLLKHLEWGWTEETAKAIELGIQALKENTWIPCSERLPEEHLRCLVTRKNKYEDDIDLDVREDVFIEVEGIWDWQSIFEGLTDNIVAWMPLPEPYKGE